MKAIAIDEEGYFHSQGMRWADEEICRHLLENLKRNSHGAYVTTVDGEEIFVEAFDQPLVALQVAPLKDFTWTLTTPYGFLADFDIRKLCLDEWDRFLGRTSSDISFVFSRQAQNSFFNQLETFDDDSITFNGERFSPPSWPLLQESKELQSSDWDKAYCEGRTGWDLGDHHGSLTPIIAQLKLNRARILVLGSGAGHDAAFFARAGHFVTALDWSTEANERAQKLYGTQSNLTFLQADALNPSQDLHGKFDVIFEHTCYCAVHPSKRNDLVKNWHLMLNEGGHVLAILPLFDKAGGPPFASSEWELRERFKKYFRFFYWSRSRITTPNRLGQELIVYMQKN